jgi:pilus assembly protein Flp/PilA
MRQLRLFLSSRSGATAVEYGLIVALISVVIIAGATALGSAIGGKFNWVASQWFLATS